MNNSDTRATVVTHSTNDFTWEPEKKWFVAECSHFRARPPWTVMQEGETSNQLFLGTPYCSLRNPATKREVLFVFLHTVEGNGPDYEIEAWVFGATPEECEKNPRLFGVQIHFLND